ncbi:hypothetical protein LguiA_032923 [Lonicera macranthoides]
MSRRGEESDLTEESEHTEANAIKGVVVDVNVCISFLLCAHCSICQFNQLPAPPNLNLNLRPTSPTFMHFLSLN